MRCNGTRKDRGNCCVETSGSGSIGECRQESALCTLSTKPYRVWRGEAATFSCYQECLQIELTVKLKHPPQKITVLRGVCQSASDWNRNQLAPPID
jgi:hypothetical protein